MKLQSTQELSATALKTLQSVLNLELGPGAVLPPELLTTIQSWDVIARESFFEALVRRLAKVKQPETTLKLMERFADDVMAIRVADALVELEEVPEDFKLFELTELLRGVGTTGALMELQRIAFTAKEPNVVMQAHSAIQREADHLGVRRWKIEDEIVPDCGLNRTGPTELSNGEKTYTFKLDVALKPTLVDNETYDRYSELPEPATIDEQFAERQKEWHVIKNHVEDVVPVQVQRLEQALALQYRWDIDHWKNELCANPMMNHLVQRVLWARYRTTGRFLESFRVLDDGSFADAHDEPFELDDEGLIGLLHSADLTNEIATDWGVQFADYEIVTLFPQIDRPLFDVPADQKKEASYRRDLELPLSAVQSVLYRRGWKSLEGYWSKTFTKVFRFHDISASISYEEKDDTFRFQGASFRRFLGYPDHSFQLRDVPKVVFSEVLFDVDLLSRI